ncbi:hypothetical protein F5Y17DRAFT_425193 [Xylariaceae sp. FL0594]|nr:hypothetical protein F5Y17DRAFT_425193 [Xylariaceae sp. FL0594]
MEGVASNGCTISPSFPDYQTTEGPYNGNKGSGTAADAGQVISEFPGAPRGELIDSFVVTDFATINAGKTNGPATRQHEGLKLSQKAEPVQLFHHTACVTQKSTERPHPATADPFVDVAGRSTKLCPKAGKRVAIRDEPEEIKTIGNMIHPMSLDFIRRLAEKPEKETDTRDGLTPTEEPEPVAQTPTKAQQPRQDPAAERRDHVFQIVLDATEGALQRLWSKERPLHAIVENYRRLASKLISKVSEHQTSELHQAAVGFDKKSVELEKLFARSAQQVRLIQKRARVRLDKTTSAQWRAVDRKLEESLGRARKVIHSI